MPCSRPHQHNRSAHWGSLPPTLLLRLPVHHPTPVQGPAADENSPRVQGPGITCVRLCVASSSLNRQVQLLTARQPAHTRASSSPGVSACACCAYLGQLDTQASGQLPQQGLCYRHCLASAQQQPAAGRPLAAACWRPMCDHQRCLQQQRRQPSRGVSVSASCGCMPCARFS